MHLIKNLLPEERRKKVIEDLKPLLVSSLEMDFYGNKNINKELLTRHLNKWKKVEKRVRI